MKRTIIIISILIVSALIAFLWVYIDDHITRSNHPLPEEYTAVIDKYSEEYAVPKELVFAVIKTESDFKSDVVSNAGAVGLMQVTPDTFLWLSKKTEDKYDDVNLLYNPEINIKYGVYYLSWLYSRYGSWETALAAYNAGHGKVDSWLENPEYSKNGVLTNIPYKETREYVKKVMNAKDTYKKLYFEN